MNEEIELLFENGGINPPAKKGDAGYDVESREHVILPPRAQGGWQKIALGNDDGPLRVLAPEGYWYEFRVRSGLVIGDDNLMVAPTVIDLYTGDLFCFCANIGDEPMEIKPGDRICQLVLHKTVTPKQTKVDKLPETERGSTGFNSTGRGKTPQPPPPNGTVETFPYVEGKGKPW